MKDLVNQGCFNISPYICHWVSNIYSCIVKVGWSMINTCVNYKQWYTNIGNSKCHYKDLCLTVIN